MKKLLTFFALGLALSNSFAHPKNPSSELNLKLYDNGFFTVILDNNFLKTPSNNFFFKNLKPGNHFLKVIKHYPITRGCAEPTKLIFNGFIHIPPKSKIFAFIDLFNQFEIYSMESNFSEPVCNNNENIFYENNHCENPIQSNPMNMNSASFFHLRQSIINANFDNDKLKIAKQGISANGISSQQVLELMELLTFESNKLKLAKFAYPFTFDKQNFFVVNNGFTYSSSIEELNRYVSIN